MGTYRYSGEYIYPAEITIGILKTMEMSQKGISIVFIYLFGG